MTMIADILTENNVILNLESMSKKKVFERISEICAARTQLEADVFYHGLIQRERLGSTGLGEGIAIPHARLHALTQPIACFLQLKHEVDFDAPDDRGVDLVFALFVPEHATEAHLELLSIIAKFFNEADNRVYLRQPSATAHEVFCYLTKME